MSVGEKSKKSKRYKKNKRSKLISFEEEIISRNEAEKLLSKCSQTAEDVKNSESLDSQVLTYVAEYSEVGLHTKKKMKKKSRENNELRTSENFQNEGKSENEISTEGDISSKTKKEKKKSKDLSGIESLESENVGDISGINSEISAKTKKKKKKSKDLSGIESFESENVGDILGNVSETKKKKKKSKDLSEIESFQSGNGDILGNVVEISAETKNKKSKDLSEIEPFESENVGDILGNISEISPETKNKKKKSKDFGEIILFEIENVDSNLNEAQLQSESTLKKNKRKHKQLNDNVTNIDNEVNNQVKPKKRKKQVDEKSKIDHTDELNCEQTESEGNENSASKPAKKESIRQRKRKKHLKLLEEKKTKIELALQEKALNYLSRWKHSRQTWKFEKLRQIWLQQNLFDQSKVPSEFWDTLLEYFMGAKGHAKSVLIEKAVKIIEENKSNIDNDDGGNSESLECEERSSVDEKSIKLKRARELVQYLQEE